MKAEYGVSVEVSQNNWKKVTLILDAKDGETPHQLMDRVEEEVETWFAKRLPRITERLDPSIIFNEITPREIKVEKISEEERIDGIIEALYKCTTLQGDEGLLSFHSCVQRESNTRLTTAFEGMYQKLTLKD